MKTKVIEDTVEGFAAKDIFESIFCKKGLKEVRVILNSEDDSEITDWNENGKCEVKFSQKLQLPQNLTFIVGGRGSLPIVEQMIYYWDEDGSLKIESQIVMQIPGGSMFNTKVDRILKDLQNNGIKRCKVTYSISCSVSGFWGFQTTIENLMVQQGEEQCLGFVKASKDYLVEMKSGVARRSEKNFPSIESLREREKEHTPQQKLNGFQQLVPPTQQHMQQQGSNGRLLQEEKQAEVFQEAEDHGGLESQTQYGSMHDFAPQNTYQDETQENGHFTQISGDHNTDLQIQLQKDLNSSILKLQSSQQQTNRLLQEISQKLGQEQSKSYLMSALIPSWRHVALGIFVGCVSSSIVIAFQMHQNSIQHSSQQNNN